MKEKDYSKKISLEKRIDIYEKLSNVLMDHYPFHREEDEILTPIQDIIDGRLCELNKQYITLMNKTK